MKQLLLMATMVLMFGAANAQIAEVKQENSRAKIYNDQGSYTGKYIDLSSSANVSGYNSKFIVITEGSRSKIYDSNGSFIGKYIDLSSGSYVKNVSATAILIQEGSRTKYFDFNGTYTGKYTDN